MTEADQGLQRLLQLRQQFREQLPSRLQELERDLEATLNRSEPDTEALLLPLHNLIGSSGTFGYPQVSELARQLHQYLKTGTPLPDEAIRSTVRAMQHAAASEPLPMPQSTEPDQEAETLRQPPIEKVIYYSVSHEEMDRELMQQLAQFRMRTVRCQDNAELRQQVEQGHQEAVMMLFFGNEPITEAAMQAVMPKRQHRESIHVILISTQRDLRSRLIAAKFGVDAFLRAPTSLTEVLDTIERLRPHGGDENIRVLIIDDQESVGQYHEAILQSAGMRVQRAHNIDQLDSVLQQFTPEIILLDLFLPDWSGGEVAKALHQQMELLDVPIVFLSSESDRELQLAALRSGGDDFLTKPIKPDFLVDAVRIRARRYRELRRIMLNDGLTSVYNRRSILQMLGQEMARSQRNNTALTVAIIDVDHFKKVNDTHGHLTGDLVLKTLTQLLKQRLRRSDLIGRYGGEEFIVVLPDASKVQALKFLDEIRETFADIEHLAEQPFKITFSGGVAEYRMGESQRTILERADQALYRAKHEGRNRLLG